ncbi:hypothetical protein [Paenibacillus marchantiophytorum]|nr:hypothetical protein [Paenibacillus marchantiophytorum]
MARYSAAEEVVIMISAGFATAPYFLDAFGMALSAQFNQEGIANRVVVHYPYGDWTRHRGRQLSEIISDLWRNAHGKPSIYGGESLISYLTANLSARQQVLLIGHSAGGVASIQAAEMVIQQGYSLLGVIQIGSPKCAIPPNLRNQVLYLKAANQLNQAKDPVPRLGTWGGWSKTRLGLRRWNRVKHAPNHRQTLPLIGGHADYFRDHNPYIWQDTTNLQTTMKAIWTWLKRSEKDDEHD